MAAELLRQGTDVAYPTYDGGVDLLAYCEHDFHRVVPIQVKSRPETCYNFQKSWFDISGLVLVQVWHTVTNPEFYIFDTLEQVEDVLGDHCKTESWKSMGGFSVTDPCKPDVARMRPHRNRWERIEERLRTTKNAAAKAGK